MPAVVGGEEAVHLSVADLLVNTGPLVVGVDEAELGVVERRDGVAVGVGVGEPRRRDLDVRLAELGSFWK